MKRHLVRGFCDFFSETGTEGGYWAFQDERHISGKDGGDWYYRGLYLLENGDILKIYDKYHHDHCLWEGMIEWMIDLEKISFFSLMKSVFGLRVHSIQEGIDFNLWALWFLNEYPAELLTDRWEFYDLHSGTGGAIAFLPKRVRRLLVNKLDGMKLTLKEAYQIINEVVKVENPKARIKINTKNKYITLFFGDDEEGEPMHAWRLIRFR